MGLNLVDGLEESIHKERLLKFLDGESIKDLAKYYDVKESTIAKSIMNRVWHHIYWLYCIEEKKFVIKDLSEALNKYSYSNGEFTFEKSGFVRRNQEIYRDIICGNLAVSDSSKKFIKVMDTNFGMFEFNRKVEKFLNRYVEAGWEILKLDDFIKIKDPYSDEEVYNLKAVFSIDGLKCKNV